MRALAVGSQVGPAIDRVLPILVARDYLSTAEVAEMIGVGVDTIEAWRARGDGPAWYRFGRTAIGRGRSRVRTLPRYRRSDVEAWIASKRVEPAKE